MDGRVLFAIRNRDYFIRLEGPIRYTISTGFAALIDSIFEKSRVDSVCIDLSDTEYIDSTNLGLLARIANGLRAINGKKVSICKPNESILTVLCSMGFDEVFDLHKLEPCEKVDFKPVPFCDGKIDKSRLILDTHKTLMDMNEKNRQEFKNVVEVLEKQVEESDDQK